MVQDKEVDINQTNSSGYTALQLLFQYNRSFSFNRYLRALFQRKSVDVNVLNELGDSVLIIACYLRRDGETMFDTVSLLLAHGCDANIINSEGWNSLLALCCRPFKRSRPVPKMFEIVRLLLQAGADVTPTAKDGSTLFFEN